MAKITAEELYKKLLDIKHTNPDYEFSGLDLLPPGSVDQQYQQLVSERKIFEKNDVIGSFEVLE